MRHSLLVLSSLTVLSAAACASGGAPAGGAAASDVTTPRLQGLLQPRAGSVSGEVSVSPTDRAGQFRVALTLRGSAPGQQHPWHVHRGRCDAEGPIVGSTIAYPVLQIRGDGNVDLNRTIDASLDPAAAYYVDVHASRANMDLIIACADLLPAR
jgi:hypothetical protein